MTTCSDVTLTSSQAITVRELDPDMIPPSVANVQEGTGTGGSKITVIGKPGSGKSWIIRSLLYAKRACFPIGMVVSGTEDSNHFYEQFFPSTFIHNSLDVDLLERFKKRQKVSQKYIAQPWGVILLDDCTDDCTLLRSKLFHDYYKNGRHWNMFFILSLQYCMDISPALRTNVDGVFILREPSLRNRKIIWENYASIVPTFKLFCHIMDEVTEDYTALYIHNRVQSNDWQECVFWYRASPVPDDWRFGCKEYWDFHYSRFDSEYDKVA